MDRLQRWGAFGGALLIAWGLVVSAGDPSHLSFLSGIGAGHGFILLAALAPTRFGWFRRRSRTSRLGETTARFQETQRIAHLGSWEWEVSSGKVFWSDESYRIFGLLPGSVAPSYQLFLDLVHPDDREMVKTHAQHSYENCAPYSIEYRILRADGEVRHLLSQAELVTGRQGRIERMVGTNLDITERKRDELALLNSRQQLRAMAAYHEGLLEEERKHIAREVHDELGQLLTALKMDISLLRLRFGGDPALQRKAEEMRVLVDRTLDVVRHVASNLRPAALDHGIVPAIEWLAEDFGHRWEIPCEVTVRGRDIVLDDAQATAVFRVVQESLTNVARHAQASAVAITLDGGLRGLQLRVQDNGCGFDSAVVRRAQGFGLLGMRERVLALGGSLKIDSAPGGGTSVVIDLPCRDGEQP
ncbi:MAG TPA: PAS domain-containing protein [Rhodocyclaceae bacterium]|nr:PAS domain-containing protein [Rhodocyclaceae bacterium]